MRYPIFHKLFPILSKRGKTDVSLQPSTDQHDDSIDKLRGEILYQLQQRYDDDCTNRIGITSTDYGEGAYKTAYALAVSLASVQDRVLLIDLDLRNHFLSDTIPVKGKHGIETFLSDPVGPAGNACFYALNEKLDFLPAMHSAQDPSGILESLHRGEVFDSLSASYNAIVCSLPPICDFADAASVARDLDGIVMTVREGYTQQGVLTSSLAASAVLAEKTIGCMYYKTK